MALPSRIYWPGGKPYINGSGLHVAISIAQAVECCCGITPPVCDKCNGANGCIYCITALVDYHFHSLRVITAPGGAHILTEEIWIDAVGLALVDAEIDGQCNEWLGDATRRTITQIGTDPATDVTETGPFGNVGAASPSGFTIKMFGSNYHLDGDCDGAVLTVHTSTGGVMSPLVVFDSTETVVVYEP